jgi:ubiquinone/menaquinone biosynthesis C-methylase UbiE
MPEHLEIYRQQAGQYEALVSCEDYQHNLLEALQKITSFKNTTVVELGAGTGRLTCLLVPLVKTIHAFDISQHMLDVAVDKLKKSGLQNWHTAISDHRRIGIKDDIADITISAWSVCYVVVNAPETWQDELQKALSEMKRVTRQGGFLILIETLGTGSKQPDPPSHLLAYYASLESSGFQRTWIRTDYRFESKAKAEKLTRFFFGDSMVEKIEENEEGIILPECTGIWWLKS